MTLGERIMTLRTERQMSQSDLAEVLDVSRQSISKWETDSSVPELEKLVALCDIFDVTMDMLVRGNDMTESKEEPQKEPQITIPDADRQEVVHLVKLETRKIIGIMLFVCSFVCMVLGAFAGDMIAGFLLALPFIICGIICLACKKRTGLWCAWTVYLYAQVFLRFATGISTGLVGAFLRGNVGFGINVIVSFIVLLLTICLAFVTVWSFRNQDLRPAKHKDAWLLGGWAVYIILRAAIGTMIGYLLARTSMWAVSMIYILFTDWFLFVLLVLLLIWTYHWWKERRESRKTI